MKYRITYLALVFVCSISGCIISVLKYGKHINNYSKVTNSTNKFNETNQNEKTKNNTHNINDKNKIIKDNDFIKEDEEEEKKKREEEEKKKREEEEKKRREEEEKKKREEEERKKLEEEKKKREEESLVKEIDYSKKHVIHIALNIDNKYLYPTIVFLTSLLENRLPTTIYDVHILTSQYFNSDYITKIKTLIDKYGKEFVKMEFINMKDAFKEAITGTHISTVAYYRIALPSLLPNVDRIIYTDTDVINFKDLTEMYNLELKDNIYLRGALDYAGNMRELRSFGIQANKYVNSGILLMNLKSMRKYGVEQQIKDFINTHYLDHHDQTAINGVCYNNMEKLSVKYAVFNFDSYKSIVKYNNDQDKLVRYSEDELKQGFYSPTLLHYAGWTKPWDKGNNIKLSEYWWYYAKKTDYYDEIIRHYGFSMDTIEILLKKIPKKYQENGDFSKKIIF
jgi:lipopolysaccharide biosynthesis glycosyltransferase